MVVYWRHAEADVDSLEQTEKEQEKEDTCTTLSKTFTKWTFV